MSSYHKVTTDIRDQASLVAGLGAMGYADVESHAEAVELHNHWGKDHGVSKAEVVIRVKALQAKHAGRSSVSDVGFKRQADGTFALEANDMDRSIFDKSWLGRVKVAVGTAKTMKMARMQYGCAKPIITHKMIGGRPKTLVKYVVP